MTATPEEIRLLEMELKASQEQINRTLDALRKRVSSLLPEETGNQAAKFRRYTSVDWDRHMEGRRRCK